MNFRVSPVIVALVALLGSAEAWAQAAPQPAVTAPSCRLCSAPSVSTSEGPVRPLRIEIESGLDFSKLAAGQSGGIVTVDPKTSDRRISGDIVNLGGMAFSGTVRLSGEPGRRIRVILPDRVELVSSLGGRVEVGNIRTDLSPAPTLGSDGTLSFSFGGQLEVKGPVSGEFRGRIAIEAEYE